MSSLGVFIKGVSVIWVSDIGVSVIGMFFYGGVDLGVYFLGDVFERGVTFKGGILLWAGVNNFNFKPCGKWKESYPSS